MILIQTIRQYDKLNINLLRDDILIKKDSSVVDSMSTENLEEIQPRIPKTKAKTRVAKAKALLRKGIKTNTKITFDEEGNVSFQRSNAKNERLVVYKFSSSFPFTTI